MATFTLSVSGAPIEVTVQFSPPASWATHALFSRPGKPAWKLEGARMLSLVAIDTRGDDDAARVEAGIAQQFSDLSTVERTELPGGRVWTVRKEDDGGVHARLFVPFAQGVVMGVAQLDGTDALAGVKAAFETITL